MRKTKETAPKKKSASKKKETLKKRKRPRKKESPKRELLVGASEYMERIRAQIKKASPTDILVLILGETGTGKELIARSIHQQSTRRTKPFVPLNCAAIPSHLFESELFGYKKGAFTDAKKDKEGLVAVANKGTLFLDEIGDLSVENQSKLLRFLESGEYSPVGGSKTEYSEARIVAATNKELRSEIEKGNFREDLYQRIAGYAIKTEPLSDSRADVVLLTNHFLGEGKNTPEKAKIKSILYSTYFPGNARQLRKVVEVATALGYQEVSQRLMDFHFERLKEASRKVRPSGNVDTEQRADKEEVKHFKREHRSLDRFLEALRWTDRTDPKELRNAVLAYEIIILMQETKLSQRQIASNLRIHQRLSSSSNFRSKFGFDLPDRGKRKYPVTHPMNTNKRYYRNMAIPVSPPE